MAREHYDAMGQMTQTTAESLAEEQGGWMRGYLATLGLARIGVGWAASELGLRALSDDDYARATIAQRFAEHAQLDPSGTSWLPFPFWVTGTVMKVLDPSLDVARVVASALAVGAVWVLFAAGLLFGLDRWQAFLAALGATLLPVVAVLGSVAVPELPAAALSVFALVAATAPASTRATLVAAGLAMIGATLSRYEAWPVAAVVAAFIGLRRDEPVFYRRALLAALPLVGPVFWILHNRIAHGDALSFLHRVSSYKAALGAGGANAIGAYLWGVLAGCPAVLALFVGLVVLATRGNDRDELRRRLARYVPFGIAALALAAFLSIGDLVGGAPTHHPERVLLVVWLACALAAADLATVVRPPPALVAVVVLLLALDYRATLADRGVDRRSEETSGAQLRSLVPRGEHVVVATTDYGYFAVIAAFGRPSDAIVDLSHDPRVKSEKSIVADHWHAPDHLRQEGARWLVAPSTAVFPMALRERTRDATLAIYELER